MSTRTITVAGMTCSGCASAVRAELSQVPGVRSVDVDVTKGTVTIGSDKQVAATIEQMGARHADCACESVVVDAEHKLVTTPAYMLGKGPAQVFEGIRRLVGEILRLAGG